MLHDSAQLGSMQMKRFVLRLVKAPSHLYVIAHGIKHHEKTKEKEKHA